MVSDFGFQTMEAFSIWKKRIYDFANSVKRKFKQDVPLKKTLQNLLIKQEVLIQENALQKKIINQLTELNSSMSTLNSYRDDSSLFSGRSSPNSFSSFSSASSEFWRCEMGHSYCRIDHAKYNYVKEVPSKNENYFNLNLIRWMDNLQVVYGLPQLGELENSDWLDLELHSIWLNVEEFKTLSFEFMDSYKPRIGPSPKTALEKEKNPIKKSFPVPKNEGKRTVSFPTARPFKLGGQPSRRTVHHHHHYVHIPEEDFQTDDHANTVISPEPDVESNTVILPPPETDKNTVITTRTVHKMVPQEGPWPWGYGKVTGPAFVDSDEEEENFDYAEEYIEESFGDQVLYTNDESYDINFPVDNEGCEDYPRSFLSLCCIT